MSERKRSGYARQYNIRSEMTGPDMTHQQYPVPLHTALSEHAHGKDTQTIIIYTAAMDLPASIVNKDISPLPWGVSRVFARNVLH